MMKSFSFLYSKNTLFGIAIGFSITPIFAFKLLADPPACAIALDKMNVLYMGVNNPITVVARGVPMEQLVVQGEGVKVEKVQGDHYVVYATTPGEASITVSGGTLPPQTFRYRIKRFPDPGICLGGNPRNRSGYIGNGEFKIQGGLSAPMNNSDFGCGNCEMMSFQVTYKSKANDIVMVQNMGAKFNPAAQVLIAKAQPGDQYFFDNVKVKCPGDVVARDMGSMSFTIK